MTDGNLRLLVALLTGIIAGMIFSNHPIFVVDYKIDFIDMVAAIISFVGILVAVRIAVQVPIVLDRILTQSREVKTIVYEAVKSVHDHIGYIDTKVEECLQKGAFSPADDKLITRMFKNLNNRIHSMGLQLKDCKINMEHEALGIQQLFIEYKSAVTGEYLVNKNKQFYKDLDYHQKRCSENLERGLRMLKMEVIKYNLND
jgi:hypothetical protein